MSSSYPLSPHPTPPHLAPCRAQDDYAISSYERAQAATAHGYFKDEIVPVEVPGVRGKPSTMVDKDDEVSNVSISADSRGP